MGFAFSLDTRKPFPYIEVRQRDSRPTQTPEAMTNTTTTRNDDAEIIREMMQVWDSIVRDVRAAYPAASDETVYQISKSVMNDRVGLS